MLTHRTNRNYDNLALVDTWPESKRRHFRHVIIDPNQSDVNVRRASFPPKVSATKCMETHRAAVALAIRLDEYLKHIDEQR